MAGATVQILNDQKAILDAVQGAEIASNRIPEIIQSAWPPGLSRPSMDAQLSEGARAEVG